MIEGRAVGNVVLLLVGVVTVSWASMPWGGFRLVKHDYLCLDQVLLTRGGELWIPGIKGKPLVGNCEEERGLLNT